MICYDISDPRARRTVERQLLGLGERVQESVFECHLDIESLRVRLRQLGECIDGATDSLRAYPLCAWCEPRVTWHGEGRRADDPDLYLI